MAQLTVAQYDAVENAIRDRQRILVRRLHRDVIVVPERLVLRNRREAIEARHPTTGELVVLWVDEADLIEVVR